MCLSCCGSRGLQAMQRRLPTTPNGCEHRPNAKMMQGPVRPEAASACMGNVEHSGMQCDSQGVTEHTNEGLTRPNLKKA